MKQRSVLLENRTDLVKELFDYPDALKSYLAKQAWDLLNDNFLNALPGLVSTRGSERIVEEYLQLMSRWQEVGELYEIHWGYDE